jgi:phosphoadenosine phosphosulfate reductase
LCAFSGGKDSQCCYHLLKDAGIPFTPQYSITRFEPPEALDFIRAQYPDCEIRRGYKMSLVDEIEYRGLPNRWFRWCCESKHKKQAGFDIAVIGVRAAESNRRAANWRTFGRKADGLFYVCPVFDWTEAEVWEYLDERNIPHCRLYDEGYTRIGCVCCPLASHHMRADSVRWPKFAKVLYLGHTRNWKRAMSRGGVTKSGKPFKMLEFGTPLAAFEHWLDTGRTVPDAGVPGGDEPCLFAGTGFSESDGASKGETT